MGSDCQFTLEYFDKFCRIYQRLITLVVFHDFLEKQNALEPALSIPERFEIVGRILRKKIIDPDSSELSEDNLYEDLRIEYENISFGKVGVDSLRENDKH